MIKKVLVIIALVALVLGVYILIFDKQPEQTAPPANLVEALPADLRQIVEAEQKAKEEPVKVVEVVDTETLLVTATGNGLDTLNFQVVNSGGETVSYEIAAGTQFESGLNQVMLTEDISLAVEAGQTGTAAASAIPLKLNNREGFYTYREVENANPQAAKFFEVTRENGVGSGTLLRTAALILIEDPELKVIANFPTVGDAFGSTANERLQVGVVEILDALELIKNIGFDVSSNKLADNEQLKLEAMVKPETHERAKSFYDLEDELKEWAYWRKTLESGDVRLKHYALYGIGRYFPDVAVEMMPGWIRNRKIIPTYRLSAVYALAFTGRVEAVRKLAELEAEFPSSTNMGKATREASRYLKSRI